MFVSYPCAGRIANRTATQSGAARALVAAAPHVDRVHPRPGCTLERAGDAADAHVAPAPAEDDRAMIRRPHPGREDGLRRAEAAPAPADHLGDGPGTTAAHRIAGAARVAQLAPHGDTWEK